MGENLNGQKNGITSVVANPTVSRRLGVNYPEILSNGIIF